VIGRFCLRGVRRLIKKKGEQWAKLAYYQDKGLPTDELPITDLKPCADNDVSSAASSQPAKRARGSSHPATSTTPARTKGKAMQFAMSPSPSPSRRRGGEVVSDPEPKSWISRSFGTNHSKGASGSSGRFGTHGVGGLGSPSIFSDSDSGFPTPPNADHLAVTVYAAQHRKKHAGPVHFVIHFTRGFSPLFPSCWFCLFRFPIRVSATYLQPEYLDQTGTGFASLAPFDHSMATL
jgi:hypothetical protein